MIRRHHRGSLAAGAVRWPRRGTWRGEEAEPREQQSCLGLQLASGGRPRGETLVGRVGATKPRRLPTEPAAARGWGAAVRGAQRGGLRPAGGGSTGTSTEMLPGTGGVFTHRSREVGREPTPGARGNRGWRGHVTAEPRPSPNSRLRSRPPDLGAGLP